MNFIWQMNFSSCCPNYERELRVHTLAMHLRIACSIFTYFTFISL